MKKVILIILLLCPNLCYATSQSLFEPHAVNNLWYAWSEYDGVDTEIYCSRWDGSEWAKPYQLTDNSSNDLSPAVAIDNNGNPWVVWIGEDGVSTSIYSSYWDGSRWAGIRQVDDVDIYEDTTPAITIDNNNIPWVAWAGTDSTDDDIYVSKWTGKNWAPPEMINTDDATPDLVPAINIDAYGNLIVAWCGFYNGRYRLFFSQRLKNNWTEEKLVAGEQRFSAELPSIFRRQNGLIELLWLEKNLSYTSLWDGKEWSLPESREILLPEGFFEKLSVNVFGLSCVSWLQDGIAQSLRIIPQNAPSPKPPPQRVEGLANRPKELLAWLNDVIIPSAQADVEPNKYIAFGDSITEWPIEEGYEGYPPRLERKLDANIAPSTVINAGVGGERTWQGLERIDNVLRTHNAQFMLLMEGTNDVTFTYTSDSVKFNLEQMIDRAVSYGTTAILATLPPRRDGLDSRTRTDYNVKITELAGEKGATLVDMYEPLAEDKDTNIKDHVHPTAKGFEIMANQWFDAIDSILNPPEEEDDDDSGCGFVPPMYPGDKNKGLQKNLIPLLLAVCFILLLRRLCYS